MTHYEQSIKKSGNKKVVISFWQLLTYFTFCPSFNGENWKVKYSLCLLQFCFLARSFLLFTWISKGLFISFLFTESLNGPTSHGVQDCWVNPGYLRFISNIGIDLNYGGWRTYQILICSEKCSNSLSKWSSNMLFQVEQFYCTKSKSLKGVLVQDQTRISLLKNVSP